MPNSLNILVTGTNGQLGSEIKGLSKEYKYNFFFVTKEELDISKFEKVKVLLQEKNIGVIINCAAYTAVDKAQDDIEKANLINNLAVKNLAELSKKSAVKLIHISTDYVFDGTNYRPYREDDLTNPCNIYGKSKHDGEKAIININPKDSIIIRTSWVYSFYGNNFVKTMIKLGKQKDKLSVIFDQIGTPTYAKDLAKTILDIIPLIKNENVEIYNYSNEGVLSWYDFAKEIMKMAKLPCVIEPIESFEYPTPSKRPYYSLLNKAKIKNRFNIKIPYWKDGLDDCLKRLGERR
ncbi:dTDP-4-dehydrorhamnose reductase [Halarcobacter ebronensis]|uniref:dTDP-4-dehydrorhamnose reductase n=1 Tax=Halarcobacter ebronensis TaxID=1462615 RepID=A0A4Q0YFX8_9BACT|nr:dTDP-4-dehydrorhamnose reductase [Halarcobacter ebronensis]RXJ69153.1 dTDP-4-dehydrorhamnose reductase [Halarcobacter ebronensis]